MTVREKYTGSMQRLFLFCHFPWLYKSYLFLNIGTARKQAATARLTALPCACGSTALHCTARQGLGARPAEIFRGLTSISDFSGRLVPK